MSQRSVDFAPPMEIPPYGLSVWILRVLGRMLATHFQLREEDRERVTMLRTFLALMRDEQRGELVKDEDLSRFQARSSGTLARPAFERKELTAAETGIHREQDEGPKMISELVDLPDGLDRAQNAHPGLQGWFGVRDSSARDLPTTAKSRSAEPCLAATRRRNGQNVRELAPAEALAQSSSAALSHFHLRSAFRC